MWAVAEPVFSFINIDWLVGAGGKWRLAMTKAVIEEEWWGAKAEKKYIHTRGESLEERGLFHNCPSSTQPLSTPAHELDIKSSLNQVDQESLAIWRTLFFFTKIHWEKSTKKLATKNYEQWCINWTVGYVTKKNSPPRKQTKNLIKKQEVSNVSLSTPALPKLSIVQLTCLKAHMLLSKEL